MLVFAADHGIARQGVSIASSEVTAQMVHNFLAGGAAINCFCRTNDVRLKVIDAGMQSKITHPELIQQSIGPGTGNLALEAAMGVEQAERCLLRGAELARKQVGEGADILCFGEMGIGNTSAASAMLAALTGWSAEICTGKGTGISEQQLKLKAQLIDKGLQRLRWQEGQACEDYRKVLCEVGGFEIGQICGAMLGTAEMGKPILVDGFIVTVAALLACRINPTISDYLFFAHCSEELAHHQILSLMNASPMLKLGLRLGEGTGAALAMPLLRSVVSFYNDMASFDSAGVTV